MAKHIADAKAQREKLGAAAVKKAQKSTFSEETDEAEGDLLMEDFSYEGNPDDDPEHKIPADAVPGTVVEKPKSQLDLQRDEEEKK